VPNYYGGGFGYGMPAYGYNAGGGYAPSQGPAAGQGGMFGSGIPWQTGVALGLGAYGGYLDARSRNAAAAQQNMFNQGMFNTATGMMQNDPSALEKLGLGQYNMSQDSLMQMLRADPNSKVDQTLQGIAQSGNPFDASALFQSLGVLDSQALDQSVGGLRAGAAGLGQRFGTAMRNSEVDLRTQAGQQAAARNAQIGMQSHESAQARVLQALAALSGREQFRTETGLQANSQQTQLLQMLLAAEAQRRSGNANLLGIAGGMGQPVAQPGYGGFLSGLGSLLMFSQVGQRRNKGAGGGTGGGQIPTQSQGPWTGFGTYP
jgi:hypothetical protein